MNKFISRFVIKKHKWYNKFVSKVIRKEIENIEKMENAQNQNIDSNLDINLIIATFQEKLSQIMTELIVKEATIKQLTAIIEKQKGY